MQSKGNGSFSDTQQTIDRMQAQIRSCNEQQVCREKQREAAEARPSLWRRLLDRLRR